MEYFMQAPEEKIETVTEFAGRVLVVDDDRATRTIHRAILSKQFEVETASSGEEALAICEKHLPDLVLLDVEMDEMDGYETCRRIRLFSDLPIIFATSKQSIEEHLKAFDAGADDIITKPAVREILLRKIGLEIQGHQEKTTLKNEKNSLQNMAMSFLSAIGENGVLQQFMQSSLTCGSPKDLGHFLVEAIQRFNLECSVLIRDHLTTTIWTSHGAPSELEKTILEQSASMGRLFQFKKRLVVNYDRVSVIVTNMPIEDSEKTGRLRDYIAILAEMTHTLCENVDMRQSSMARSEQLQVALTTAVDSMEGLQKSSRNAQLDSRLLLEEMVDNVEKTYSWLGTSRSQEESISKTMQTSVDKIITLLEATGQNSNQQFEKVLNSLHAGHVGGEVDVF
jgi:CheY-like chemotaxis protein